MEDFFDKHKALIITLLIFAVLLLGLYNIRISGANQNVKEMLVELENFKKEEPEKQTPETEDKTPEKVKRSIRTHQAFNENQEARDFNNQLQEILQKNAAAQPETSDREIASSQGSYSFNDKKNRTTRQKSDGNKTSVTVSSKTGGIQNSSISFSLKDRSAIAIPNPIYTCSSSGVIVVNIKVDAGGKVISTSINKASSTSSNQCLTDKALEYAGQAVFTELPGRDGQPGTITYNFKP